MKDTLVIGSRGSKLALIQAQLVKSELELLEPLLEVRIEIIKTSGDGNTDPLAVIGGKGVFTKELEQALLDKRIDLAVHSLKDLPTRIPQGLFIAAICKREDPRDALVLNKKLLGSVSYLQELPKRAIVGTSSPRRFAQLRRARRDLVIKELRGNVDTRLRKLDEGEYDALVLACAGLRRLGLADRITVAIPAFQMIPAVGQGALGIEVRAADEITIGVVSKLDHKFTRLACEAERAFLSYLGGGCQSPIAAHAMVRGKGIKLEGLVSNKGGRKVVRGRMVGRVTEPADLGRDLAESMLRRGARELLGLEEELGCSDAE